MPKTSNWSMTIDTHATKKRYYQNNNGAFKKWTHDEDDMSVEIRYDPNADDEYCVCAIGSGFPFDDTEEFSTKGDAEDYALRLLNQYQ